MSPVCSEAEHWTVEAIDEEKRGDHVQVQKTDVLVDIEGYSDLEVLWKRH